MAAFMPRGFSTVSEVMLSRIIVINIRIDKKHWLVNAYVLEEQVSKAGCILYPALPLIFFTFTYKASSNLKTY